MADKPTIPNDFDFPAAFAALQRAKDGELAGEIGIRDRGTCCLSSATGGGRRGAIIRQLADVIEAAMIAEASEEKAQTGEPE